MDDARFVRGLRARRPSAARSSASSRSAACLHAAASVARSSPWMYGIVMYLMPLISPRSWMRTTFLWVTCRASSSSFLNRFSSSGETLPVTGANDLQRDRDAELRVPRLVDRAHPAHAEHAQDLVARAERLPDASGPSRGARTSAAVVALPERLVSPLVASGNGRHHPGHSSRRAGAIPMPDRCLSETVVSAPNAAGRVPSTRRTWRRLDSPVVSTGSVSAAMLPAGASAPHRLAARRIAGRSVAAPGTKHGSYRYVGRIMLCRVAKAKTNAPPGCTHGAANTSLYADRACGVPEAPWE